jgi:hypothetical protein
MIMDNYGWKGMDNFSFGHGMGQRKCYIGHIIVCVWLLLLVAVAVGVSAL